MAEVDVAEELAREERKLRRLVQWLEDADQMTPELRELADLALELVEASDG